MKHVYLSWHDLEELISKLVMSLDTPYDTIMTITRGGIIPGGMIAEALKMRDVLTASVEFTEDPSNRTRLSWPKFQQFPADSLLRGRKILVVDNLWFHGLKSMAVKGRIQTAGGFPQLAVLHWKKVASYFPDDKPDFYGEITEDFIHYPWQRIDDSDYRIRVKPLVPVG